jgi:6-phosphofructokinase 1
MIQGPSSVVADLGQRRYPSPLAARHGLPLDAEYFVSDSTRVRYAVEFDGSKEVLHDLSFEKAGPRSKVFFNPTETRAAVVTCGGLCPGLNNVIRSIFYELYHNYGVRKVFGIQNGYLGLNPDAGFEPKRLSHDDVEESHHLGGTMLGSSRGPQDPDVMADFLRSRGINILFCLGGDGTQRGALALQQAVAKRKLPLAVVGIPKTIDNDIPFVWQSFGYDTALEKAAEVIRAAHVEARGAINGIGLVKLMGRDAGFVAAGATIVSQEVNFTLIPEIPFPLEGDGGLLRALESRIRDCKHAVVVVAEGAGQHLFEGKPRTRDESGNLLHHDIGEYLKQQILAYFKQRGLPCNLKYLDPSYFIRSIQANARDRVVTDQMGRQAVHAAMAGKTALLIGSLHNKFIHVPIGTAVASKKQLNTKGDFWKAVLSVTGQPNW